MTLNKNYRSNNSPAAIYGIAPGFNISDLDRSYDSGAQTVPTAPINAASSGTVSAAIDIGSRFVALHATFVGATAKANILVYTSDDGYSIPVATFLNVTESNGTRYVGGYASRTGDSANGSYVATQYGPSGAQSEATTGLSEATDHNYAGGFPYNPYLYLSLIGTSIKIEVAAVTGTVSVTVTPEG